MGGLKHEGIAESVPLLSVGVGADIGQKANHTSVAVAEFRMTPDARYMLALVRQWERYELGLPWQEMATRIARTAEAVADILREQYQREKNDLKRIANRTLHPSLRNPQKPRVFLRLDATGVGSPIVELVRGALEPRYGKVVRLQPCYFNYGDRLTKASTGRGYAVGKAYMVGRLKSLQQRGALRISPNLLDADAAIGELLDYEIRIDERANDKYGAFSVGSHDDMVTALGLATLEDPPSARRGRMLSGQYEVTL